MKLLINFLALIPYFLFKITTQFVKYRSHFILKTFIIDTKEKFLEYWRTLPMLLLLASLAMNTRYKFKGVFCMKNYYKNMYIDEDDDNVVL